MKLIQILKKLSKDSSANLYYSGEYARDIIRRRKSGRIELVAKNILFKDLVRHVEKCAHNIYVSKSNSFIRFGVENKDVTIYLPKKGNRHGPYNSLRDDAKTRCFTINAMYIPVDSTNSNRVIDFYRGRDCIRDRQIKTIGKADTAIKKSPVIMMQAIALAAKLNYRIDNNLFYAIKAGSYLINKAPINRVRNELVYIIMSNKPSKYIRAMHKSGLLYEIIPELSICDGVTQNNKYHKYDVLTHCLIACDNTDHDLILRLAALLHDIGKVQTRDEVHKGGHDRITFYNHEVTGSKLVRKILRRLKFEKDIVQEVSELVYNHMYNYEPSKWSESAVRRFINKININEDNIDSLNNLRLFMLRKADRAGSGLDLSEISPRQIVFQDHIKKVYEKSESLNVEELDIDGNIIMEKFYLKAGPTIGKVLNHLLNVVIEDPSLNKKEVLIEEASKYLSKALE